MSVTTTISSETLKPSFTFFFFRFSVVCFTSACWSIKKKQLIWNEKGKKKNLFFFCLFCFYSAKCHCWLNCEKRGGKKKMWKPLRLIAHRHVHHTCRFHHLPGRPLMSKQTESSRKHVFVFITDQYPCILPSFCFFLFLALLWPRMYRTFELHRETRWGLRISFFECILCTSV